MDAQQKKIDALQDKVAQLEEQRLLHIEHQLEEIIRAQKEMTENQLDMERELAKYGARWGTVLMVLSGLGAAVQLFWDDIVRFFTR